MFLLILILYLTKVHNQIFQKLTPGGEPICQNLRWIAGRGNRRVECAVHLITIWLQSQTTDAACSRTPSTGTTSTKAVPSPQRCSLLERAAPRGRGDLGIGESGARPLRGWPINY